MSAKGRKPPKFKLGQVILNRYYRDAYMIIRSIEFGVAVNGSNEWAYSNSGRSDRGIVWFEESRLRALTKREASGG